MAILPTVKVKTDETDSGFMIINETDFDRKIHKVFKEKVERSTTPKAEKKEVTEDEEK